MNKFLVSKNINYLTSFCKINRIYMPFVTQAQKSTSYYCKVLGLKRNYTQQQLKSAYLEMVKKYHPDLSKQANASQKFQQVQKAYDFLQNPQNASTNKSDQNTSAKSNNKQQFSGNVKSAKQFDQKFRQHFSRKSRVDENMQFTYNLYKKHFQQKQQKKKQYVKYPGQYRQQWAHKDQKQENNWKSFGVGAAIMGLVGGSIYFVNVK